QFVRLLVFMVFLGEVAFVLLGQFLMILVFVRLLFGALLPGTESPDTLGNGSPEGAMKATLM
ncbi:hypothetical protein, partial [Litorimonas sp.]|uniref:hypothetical protein n=1 Tax=Litorimonas sp. TaxID=1892381 RepID=UPI003A8AB629